MLSAFGVDFLPSVSESISETNMKYYRLQKLLWRFPEIGVCRNHLFTPLRGVAAHTAGLFWSVTEVKGGVDHEDQISKE